jgi:hypothetical protein
VADSKGEAIVDRLFKWALLALWLLAGVILVPAYVVSNLYFEKWWKWREDF